MDSEDENNNERPRSDSPVDSEPGEVPVKRVRKSTLFDMSRVDDSMLPFDADGVYQRLKAQGIPANKIAQKDFVGQLLEKDNKNAAEHSSPPRKDKAVTKEDYINIANKNALMARASQENMVARKVKEDGEDDNREFRSVTAALDSIKNVSQRGSFAGGSTRTAPSMMASRASLGTKKRDHVMKYEGVAIYSKSRKESFRNLRKMMRSQSAGVLRGRRSSRDDASVASESGEYTRITNPVNPEASNPWLRQIRIDQVEKDLWKERAATGKALVRMQNRVRKMEVEAERVKGRAVLQAKEEKRLKDVRAAHKRNVAMVKKQFTKADKDIEEKNRATINKLHELEEQNKEKIHNKIRESCENFSPPMLEHMLLSTKSIMIMAPQQIAHSNKVKQLKQEQEEFVQYWHDQEILMNIKELEHKWKVKCQWHGDELKKIHIDTYIHHVMDKAKADCLFHKGHTASRDECRKQKPCVPCALIYDYERVIAKNKKLGMPPTYEKFVAWLSHLGQPLPTEKKQEPKDDGGIGGVAGGKDKDKKEEKFDPNGPRMIKRKQLPLIRAQLRKLDKELHRLEEYNKKKARHEAIQDQRRRDYEAVNRTVQEIQREKEREVQAIMADRLQRRSKYEEKRKAVAKKLASTLKYPIKDITVGDETVIYVADDSCTGTFEKGKLSDVPSGYSQNVDGPEIVHLMTSSVGLSVGNIVKKLDEAPVMNEADRKKWEKRKNSISKENQMMHDFTKDPFAAWSAMTGEKCLRPEEKKEKKKRPKMAEFGDGEPPVEEKKLEPARRTGGGYRLPDIPEDSPPLQIPPGQEGEKKPKGKVKKLSPDEQWYQDRLNEYLLRHEPTPEKVAHARDVNGQFKDIIRTRSAWRDQKLVQGQGPFPLNISISDPTYQIQYMKADLRDAMDHETQLIRSVNEQQERLEQKAATDLQNFNLTQDMVWGGLSPIKKAQHRPAASMEASLSRLTL